MLNDPVRRGKVAEKIVKDSKWGEEGDPLGGLNPLDKMFFRHPRVGVYVPITDPVVTRQCLLFMADEMHALVARMDRLPDRRSKSLLVHATLQRWSQAFKKKMEGK